MLHVFSGKKLRNLRRRSNLTQMQVVHLTGIAEATIHYLEHGLRKPQTKTLEKLLNLYAMRITRLERMEKIWGEDGLQKPGEPECKTKSPSPSPSPAPNALRHVFTR